MSVDILGTSWYQCRSMVQYSFTSTETRRLVRTDSPGRPPRLSHSSWTMTTESRIHIYIYIGPVGVRYRSNETNFQYRYTLMYMWQVTAKYTHTLPMWLWMKWHCQLVHGYMVYTELVPRQQQFHMAPAVQQPNSAVSTPLWWKLNNTLQKDTVTHLESPAEWAQWVC